MTSLATVHANSSPNWWTPPEWLFWVGDTFDGPWFDPCPRDWDGTWDGLEETWDVELPIYINHPGAKRGAAQRWWSKCINGGYVKHQPFIWCGFNLEQLWRLTPSPLLLPGWLVQPKQRTAFIDGRTNQRKKSPANTTFFWTTVQPATPPVPSLVLRTGAAYEVGEE